MENQPRPSLSTIKPLVDYKVLLEPCSACSWYPFSYFSKKIDRFQKWLPTFLL